MDSYSPQEILTISIKVEENGSKLYQSLAARAKDDKLKNIWNYLKDQEEAHRKIFKQMLDNQGEYIVYDFCPGEYDNYLRAIASQYIFSSEIISQKTKQGFSSDEQALDFAIDMEKESILIYSSLREHIVVGKQEVIDRVIKEEKKHFADLVALKESKNGS